MVRTTIVASLYLAACTSTTPPSPTSRADTPKAEPKAEPKPESKPAPTPTPAPKAEPGPTPPKVDPHVEADTAVPAPDPAQWACVTDGDCEQTCALGAVSRTWLARNRNADSCDDGCGWKSGKQACRDGECVTLTEDGDIDESCTKRSAPR